MFIANPFLNIRNFIQDKNGVWTPKKEPTLKMINSGATPTDKMAGTDIVIFDTTETSKKVILDSFEYTINGSGTNTHPILHLSGYDTTGNYDGNIFHILNSTGGGSRFVCTPTRIANDGSPYLEIMEYDSTANEYKFNLKMPIELPQGGRLAIRSISSYTSGDKVQYKAVYRVWE